MRPRSNCYNFCAKSQQTISRCLRIQGLFLTHVNTFLFFRVGFWLCISIYTTEPIQEVQYSICLSLSRLSRDRYEHCMKWKMHTWRVHLKNWPGGILLQQDKDLWLRSRFRLFFIHLGYVNKISTSSYDNENYILDFIRSVK